MIPFSKPFIDPAWIDLLTGVDGLVPWGSDTKNPKISNGERCRQLEEKVAKISGADYGISCSSCTQGMILGLGASGARGECYTQSFTWKSTGVAAQLQGSHVTLREIDGERWTAAHYKVSTDKGERAYAIAVDTFGMQYEPISYIPMFFDRAHSLGVRFRTLGVASFLSFSPSKIITGMEGGMILSNKKNFVEAMTNARDLISRMSEASAAMVLAGLKHLPELLEWKKETYNFYKQRFPECQFQSGQGNHQVIGMLFENEVLRDKVFDALKDEVEFKRYYEPLHLMNPNSPPLPITESIHSRILCLPSWYKCQRDEIAEKIRAVME